MDNNALNLSPEEIKERPIKHNYKYTFLDDIYEININKYYQLILSDEIFRIKNLYNYLFLRSLKLSNLFLTREMDVNKYVTTPDEFNNLLLNYIQKEKVYAVIIMNGIQQYFIPLNQ